MIINRHEILHKKVLMWFFPKINGLISKSIFMKIWTKNVFKISQNVFDANLATQTPPFHSPPDPSLPQIRFFVNCLRRVHLKIYIHYNIRLSIHFFSCLKLFNSKNHRCTLCDIFVYVMWRSIKKSQNFMTFSKN